MFATVWMQRKDYDKALISKGGGVYSRGQKEIVLSPEAQAVLGFTKARATPQERLRTLLRARRPSAADASPSSPSC